ncbi:hypothetical protein TIFTF001_022741 [Ficus carica]|uniref:Uncharacterized protein n=1 Tax=Ficus carica TaxID=3494 RepID=A0AA88DBY9_FICCA|nr:hypothetical protein TIFTF001_022741 [Ficus carica]
MIMAASAVHMDSSCSSSTTSMQASTAAATNCAGNDNNYQFDLSYNVLVDPYSRHDMSHAESNLLNTTCFSHVDNNVGIISQVLGGGGLIGDYGVNLEAGKMGQLMEIRDNFSLPPLESRSNINLNIEENNNYGNYINIAPIDIEEARGNNNNNHFMNSGSGGADNFIKGEGGMLGLGSNYGQLQGENFKMGEWDFEGFMHDLSSSSFPFLDFQV